MRALFRAISLFYDVQAVQRGRVPQRIMRKAAYSMSGRMIRRLFR